MNLLEHDILAQEISEKPNRSPIDAARAYVHSLVQLPALKSQLSEKTKNKVRHSDGWLNRFKRVGDLLVYLRRFKVSHDDPVYREMKACDLLTFEDIVSDFEIQFGPWANDCSRITDFVIGEKYSVFDILILARSYDTRSGGMFVLHANGAPVAVIIKATLSGGSYPNEWVQSPTELKYYLKSIRNDFNENFQANRAIIQSPGIPIVTFVRDSSEQDFIFRGLFRYKDLVKEAGGAKAFILVRDVAAYSDSVFNSLEISDELTKLVSRSSALSRDQRLARLKVASKKPRKFIVLSTGYDRNPDVIAEALYRAQGHCECCNKPAPFMRKSNGSAYLEVHHRVPLSMGGEDTVENAIALCPNCHREQHFGYAIGLDSIIPVDPITLIGEKIE